MEPKFQSSFIPKGPVTSTIGASIGQKAKQTGLFSFLALVIFVGSVLLALGMFGYNYYLKYRIGKMGSDLESARATLSPDVIDELTRLNNRIIYTEELVSRHQILVPLFEFLEVSTPRSVRFSDVRYSMTGKGIELTMRGEARGYAALALQADIFSKSKSIKDPIFSDLNLNEKGDVRFSFKAIVDPSLVSFTNTVEGAGTGTDASINTNSTNVPVSTSSPQVTDI